MAEAAGNAAGASATALTDEPDDRAYWHGRTPEERLRHVELLRCINYGPAAATRLQRILEISDRPPPH